MTDISKADVLAPLPDFPLVAAGAPIGAGDVEGRMYNLLLRGGEDNLREFREILSQEHFDVNYISPGGFSYLYFALWFKDDGILELLLAKKELNLNTRLNVYEGIYPATHLSLRGNDQAPTIRLLQDPRYDPNVTNSGGETILAYIISFEMKLLLRALIDSGKHITPTDKEIDRIQAIIASEYTATEWKKLLREFIASAISKADGLGASPTGDGGDGLASGNKRKIKEEAEGEQNQDQEPLGYF